MDEEQTENRIEDIIVTTAQLCYLLDITKETVSQWSKAGMPKTRRGKYSLKAVLDWRGLTNRTEGMSDEARKNKAEADWKVTKSKREKFHFDIEKGKYYEKEEAHEEWARRVLEVKNALLLQPEIISNNFADIETKEKIYQAIESSNLDMLEQFSRTGKYTPRITSPSRKRR